MPIVDPKQPVVILGGFLITDDAYSSLSCWIESNYGLTVRVVASSKFDWLLTTWAVGWRRLLDRVDNHVKELQAQSPTGKVTLIGHSSGGVMLRLYLGEKLFAGRNYSGHHRCNRLVMLGSPHQAIRATPLRALVDTLYPATFYSTYVDYVSIAGRLNLDGPNASPFAKRSASGSYRSIIGDSDVEGDGLVPINSALLKQSRHLILDDTAHGGLFGPFWYGSSERIEQWWSTAIAELS